MDRAIEWSGKGLDEIGRDARTGQPLVAVDPRYFRPTEVEQLIGDPSKAHQKLGWRHEVGFEELVREMVASDLETVKRDSWRRNQAD